MEENIKEKKKVNLIWLIGLVVLVIIFLPSVLSGNKKTLGKTAPPAPLTEVQEVPVKVVSIEAGSFYFKPNIIKIKKGERVRLEFKSLDMMHDFNVDELGIKTLIVKAGDLSLFNFSADKTGAFEFYCSVGQHRKLGQVGKLIVE